MKRTRKLPYSEGDIFTIRIGSRFFVGRIARSTGNGGILAYVFGPFAPDAPNLQALQILKPSDARLVGCVSDMKIRSGHWAIIDGRSSWNKEEWPIPEFGYADLLSGNKYARTYDDRTLNFLSERPISEKEYSTLPKDGAMGSDYLELILGKNRDPPS